MDYKTFTVEDKDGNEKEFITVYLDENSAITFVADESSPEFVAFVEANPDWNKA